MKTQSDKSPFLLPAIAGIAMILLVIAGAARIIGWLPNSISTLGDNLAIEVLSAASAKPVAGPVDGDLPKAPANASGEPRCPECGVIVSMREIDASGPNASVDAVEQKVASSENGMRSISAIGYEFTVRLEGGSRRVIIDAKPASWRPGERVIVIAGTNPLQQ